MEQPTTQRGRLIIYPCLQITIERTSEEPKICIIEIVIKTDSKRSIVTCELYFHINNNINNKNSKRYITSGFILLTNICGNCLIVNHIRNTDTIRFIQMFQVIISSIPNLKV